MIMGVIRRTFRYLDENMFTKLFKALVRPHLEYAQAVWHPSLIRDINMLESVQRRATKQIPNMTQIPYEERLKKLKLPSLLYRRLSGDMIEVYKMTHELYDQEIKHITEQKHQAGRATRGHPLKLTHRRAKTSIRHKSYPFRVVRNWNNLALSVVSGASLNRSKTGWTKPGKR